ncbi:NAD(P)-dependent dehydrogenase (short-subunit alcohol dehydrogenase family) [Curtobacterium sp. PhB115]|nr:NAD(P)-dependent dehydrogenase (short-subunit alcohol dehydrogenase family) [Curtobacterium sp. PhB115]
MSDVLVVIGVGGMGEAIARRIGTGKTVLLADFDAALLERTASALRGDGFAVETRPVDVASRESVRSLAEQAAALGAVVQIAHTAGLSPVQAPIEAVLAVDLVGVSHTIDEFGTVIASGGAGVVIASNAGQQAADALPADVQRALADTPTDQLLDLPFLAALPDPGAAYSVAKRANQVRMYAASAAWGRRGARINTISPGVISTPMGQAELGGQHGEVMRAMIATSGTGRIGTASDIAAAAEFLLGPNATFVTGTDLLVDGGVTAAVRSGALALPRPDGRPTQA